MATATNTRASWPSLPDGYYDDDRAQPDRALPDQGPAQEVIGEMSSLLRDTRRNMILGGMVLSAITIGIALEAAFSPRPVRLNVVSAVNVGLALGLIFCWLRAVALLALAGRPVHNALSEMRWKTGAPLDSRPSWLTVPPVGTNPEEWTWKQAHLMLGAARLVSDRFRLADTWMYVTAAYFMVWTVLVFLGL
jgi:hypothetical protein